jgi:ATP-dependent Clp protease ATP-binding subunit ClpX
MLEGTIINVTDKSGGNGPQNNRRNGFPGGGGGSPIGNSGGQGGGGNSNNAGGGGKGETYAVDTSNILFILSGAFVGLDKTIQDRMAKGVCS